MECVLFSTTIIYFFPFLSSLVLAKGNHKVMDQWVVDAVSVTAQAISHWLCKAEAWVHAQGTPCGICCVHSGTGMAFSLSFLFPPLVSFHRWFVFTDIQYLSGGWTMK
jgi:hypothetical protein